MEGSQRSQHFEYIYTTLINESDKAKQILENLQKKAKEIFLYVDDLEQKDALRQTSKMYELASTELTKLTNPVRTFNRQTEILLFDEKGAIENESINEDLKNSKDYSIYGYRFPLPEMEKFKRGYRGTCIITYVKNSQRGQFYLVEKDNPDFKNCINIMQNNFNKSTQCLIDRPEDGIVFGLLYDGFLFRAIREPTREMENDSTLIKAFLIDVGEIVTVESYMKMFTIPPLCRTYPAQAIPCILKSTDSVETLNYGEFLNKQLHEEHKFLVLDKIGSELHIHLIIDKNPFRSGLIMNEEEEMVNSNFINPFRQHCMIRSTDCNNETLSNILVTSSKSSNHINDDIFQNKENLPKFENYKNNKYEEEILYRKTSSNFSNDSLEKNGCKNINYLSDEENQLLYEEIPSTTNALKAVMGVVPKDESRICPFYNKKTNSCFKGSHCKFDHESMLSDGWTKDQVPTNIQIPNQIIYPSVGSVIDIKPSFILRANAFYAHIEGNNYDYALTLKDLVFSMNSTENIDKYRKISRAPVSFELVFAQYRDNLWYRARVVDVLSESNIRIFYLDYGNSDTVTLKDLRVWEDKFNCTPFQAVLCKIVGIKEKKTCPFQACGALNKMILNETLRAEIVNNINGLEVNLWTNSDINVADYLLKMGFVEKESIIKWDPSQLIPA